MQPPPTTTNINSGRVPQRPDMRQPIPMPLSFHFLSALRRRRISWESFCSALPGSPKVDDSDPNANHGLIVGNGPLLVANRMSNDGESAIDVERHDFSGNYRCLRKTGAHRALNMARFVSLQDATYHISEARTTT